ncbi:MAG: tetratricopeptide repeat protein [Chitinophagaceae bacterium]|nr:tetratricopeptide repeat protein [Chitinophagaceae bacterium]
MKYFTLLLLMCASSAIYAQQPDTVYLKSLYDRCIDFDEAQLDSLYYYADYIKSSSNQSGFNKGDVLSLRLKGIYYDLKGEYERAIDYYLQSLTAAQKIRGTGYEIAALTDLAILYSHIKQPEKAKQMYLQSAALSARRGYITSLITAYANLGAIYNQLQETDSALFFLQEGLRVGKPVEKEVDLSVIYNNMGNVYFLKKQFGLAMDYFRMDKRSHGSNPPLASLWIDYLNIADVYIEMKNYDSAHYYADSALLIARRLKSKSKESDSYALMAKLYARKGEYKAAYEYQKSWYKLDTSLVNDATNATVAGLQERYNSQKRQRDNDVLKLELERQRLYKTTSTYLLAGAVIIAILITFSLIQKRRANRKLNEVNQLIRKQNEKLLELNQEKNSLISIVSHDLCLPFATIKMWSQVIKEEANTLSLDQNKALHRIVESTKRGEELINNILDVEKAEVNQKPLCIEDFDIALLLDTIVDDFRPAADRKGIHLDYESPVAPLKIVSDKQRINRICENLISNAIKFTPNNRRVTVSLREEKECVYLGVHDEGVGIDSNELPVLFSKYSKISSQPTNGERSNGLGLSIVKRIVQELNGSITCESEKGRGSRFNVLIRK